MDNRFCKFGWKWKWGGAFKETAEISGNFGDNSRGKERRNPAEEFCEIDAIGGHPIGGGE
jgi:hypothetical protein